MLTHGKQNGVGERWCLHCRYWIPPLRWAKHRDHNRPRPQRALPPPPPPQPQPQPPPQPPPQPQLGPEATEEEDIGAPVDDDEVPFEQDEQDEQDEMEGATQQAPRAHPVGTSQPSRPKRPRLVPLPVAPWRVPSLAQQFRAQMRWLRSASSPFRPGCVIQHPRDRVVLSTLLEGTNGISNARADAFVKGMNAIAAQEERCRRHASEPSPAVRRFAESHTLDAAATQALHKLVASEVSRAAPMPLSSKADLLGRIDKVAAELNLGFDARQVNFWDGDAYGGMHGGGSRQMGTRTAIIYIRDIGAVSKLVFEDPSTYGMQDWRGYVPDVTQTGERRYSSVLNSKAFERAWRAMPAGATPYSLLVFMDKTEEESTNRSYYPVLIVSNHLSPAERRKRANWHVVALLPVLKFASTAIQRSAQATRQRKALLLECYSVLFGSWTTVMTEGLDLTDASGRTHVVYPFVGCLLADNMEIYSIAQVVSLRCACCWKARPFSSTDNLLPLRRTTATERPRVEAVLRLQADATSTNARVRSAAKAQLGGAETALRSRGLLPHANPLWSLPWGTDAYQIFGWPLIHNGAKGILEKLAQLTWQRVWRRGHFEGDDDEDDEDGGGEEDDDDDDDEDDEDDDDDGGEEDDEEEEGEEEDGGEEDEAAATNQAARIAKLHAKAAKQWKRVLPWLDQYVKFYHSCWPCIRGRFKERGMSALFGRHDGPPTFSRCTAVDINMLYRFLRFAGFGLLDGTSESQEPGEDEAVHKSLSRAMNLIVDVRKPSRTTSELAAMRVKGSRLFKDSEDAFGEATFAKMIKLHAALHPADAYEETGPIDENSDQSGEAKQADVKGTARQTNYNAGMEEQMGRRFARQAVIDQVRRVEEMTARLLCYAAKEGLQIELSWLLTEGGANPDSRDVDGISALSHAAEQGRATCVMALLKSGADAETQDKGATPIISACIEGHLDVVRALLAHGASLTPRHLRLTALQWAHHRGHSEIVRELQPGSAQAPHMPPPHAFGERVRVDPAVNRLVESSPPLRVNEIDLQSLPDHHRLRRLPIHLASFLRISRHELLRRAQPLRLRPTIAIGASDDPRVEACHGRVSSTCFSRGTTAPEFVAVGVDDDEYDDEYFGELLLAFELELRPTAPPAPQEPTLMQLCYVDYLQYAGANTDRIDVFPAYEFASDPKMSGSTPWCMVHALSDVITRVAIAPLMTWEERDFDETRLYHNTDMYVHI